MNLIGGLIGGALGGLIGGAIWVAVGYGTGYEIGWIAWGVGLACGLGVAKGTSGQGGPAGGALAAVLAVASILTAKYIVIELLFDQHVKEGMHEAMTMPGTDDERFWTVYVADQLIEQKESQGETIAWPSGVDPAEADSEAEYPAEVWQDAAARWTAMDGPARSTFRDQAAASLAQSMNAFMNEFSSELKQEGFLQSFNFMDLLFGALAIGTAFKLGAGDSAS